MNLYTFYSESHNKVYEDYFKKGFDLHLSKSFTLKSFKTEQKTSSGNFYDVQWNDCMNDKLILLKKAAEENYGEWFLYSDCDVQFFSNIYQNLIDNIDDETDLICQQDFGTICAGFMLIKSTDKIKEFINLVIENHHKANDQIIINSFRNLINYKYLPIDQYYSVGNYNGGRVWEPGQEIFIPKNIMVHHANFVVGVENKIRLMDIIRNSNNYNVI